MSEEELPEGWAEATLGEIADITLGKMLDREKRIEGKPLPYLRNINVRWGTVSLDDLLTSVPPPKRRSVEPTAGLDFGGESWAWKAKPCPKLS